MPETTDPTPAECPPGVHSMFDPCPGDCTLPVEADAPTLLARVLADQGVSQADLARRTRLSTKHVNQICQGVARTSVDVAIRLEFVLGIDAAEWMRADTAGQIAQYRDAAVLALVRPELEQLRETRAAVDTADLRERIAAALQRAHREWMRPGSDAGQHLMVDCLADAVLGVVQPGTDAGPAGEVAKLRAELDRIAELSTVTCDDGRADRFSTGARWTLRMIREVLNGVTHPAATGDHQ